MPPQAPPFLRARCLPKNRSAPTTEKSWGDISRNLQRRRPNKGHPPRDRIALRVLRTWALAERSRTTGNSPAETSLRLAKAFGGTADIWRRLQMALWSGPGAEARWRDNARCSGGGHGVIASNGLRVGSRGLQVRVEVGRVLVI